MWPHKWACYNIFLKKFEAKICKFFIVILLVSNIRTLYPLFFNMNYLLCWEVKAHSNDWNKVLSCGYNRRRKFNRVNLTVQTKSVLQLALWASLSWCLLAHMSFQPHIYIYTSGSFFVGIQSGSRWRVASKTFWWGELVSHFFCNKFNFLKKLVLPVTQVKNKIL